MILVESEIEATVVEESSPNNSGNVDSNFARNISTYGNDSEEVSSIGKATCIDDLTLNNLEVGPLLENGKAQVIAPAKGKMKLSTKEKVTPTSKEKFSPSPGNKSTPSLQTSTLDVGAAKSPKTQKSTHVKNLVNSTKSPKTQKMSTPKLAATTESLVRNVAKLPGAKSLFKRSPETSRVDEKHEEQRGGEPSEASASLIVSEAPKRKSGDLAAVKVTSQKSTKPSNKAFKKPAFKVPRFTKPSSQPNALTGQEGENQSESKLEQKVVHSSLPIVPLNNESQGSQGSVNKVEPKICDMNESRPGFSKASVVPIDMFGKTSGFSKFSEKGMNQASQAAWGFTKASEQDAKMSGFSKASEIERGEVSNASEGFSKASNIALIQEVPGFSKASEIPDTLPSNSIDIPKVSNSVPFKTAEELVASVDELLSQSQDLLPKLTGSQDKRNSQSQGSRSQMSLGSAPKGTLIVLI